MDKRIDPDLFARLMELSSGSRADLLEYLGQTSLPPDEIRRLADLVAARRASGPSNS